MPQIPVLEQQTRASQAGLGPGPSGLRGSGVAAIGQALGGVDAMLERSRAADLHKLEEDAIVSANDELMQARQHWALQVTQRREQATPGAPNFTPTLMTDFDTDMAERLGRAQSKTSRTYLNQRLQAMRADVYENALAFEGNARQHDREAKLDTALDAGMTAAEFDPEDFERILAEQSLAINASGLPAEHSELKRTAARGNLSQAAVMGLIRRDPRGTLKVLNDPQSDNAAVQALEFPDRDRLRNQAESEIRRLDAEARANLAEARESLRDEEADAFAAKASGLPSILPSRTRYLQVYGKEGAGRYHQATQLFSAYDVASSATLQTPEQAAETLAQFAPTQQAGAADQAQVHATAMRLYTEQRKAFEADPAGGLLTRDPALGQLLKAGTEGDGKAIDAYALKVTSAQQSAGIEAPRLLPLQAEEALAQQLAPDPEKPGQRAVRFAQLEQTWGKHYSTLLRQVVPKLDGLGQILPFIPGRVAARLDAASANPKPIMDALQQSGKKSELAKALTDEFEDLSGTFPSSVVADGPAVVQQYRDAAELLAAEYVRAGAAPNKAARQARQELIDSQYQIADTLRIPRREEGGRGRVVNTEAVADGTRAQLQELVRAGAFQVAAAPFQTAADAQADMRAHVSEAGFWIANGDESAAVLALPEGVVIGADGRPITRTWAQLEAAGQAGRSGVDWSQPISENVGRP